ncbi:MAG: glycosyltransferase [Candidatus Omnitrophica bacterium]|nr:glycosyltransferase [Candidatus Omnitrophota bacterium]
MKNILVIDYYFPPLLGSMVGGFKLIRFLPDLGWQPIVVSAAETVSYPKDYSLLNFLNPQIQVHRIGHKEPAKAWQFIREKLRVNYEFPDHIQTWYRPALNKAREILKTKKIDLIYSGSPSYTTAFVAMQLKKEFRVPWVAELLDAWTTNDYLHGYLQHTLIPPLYNLLNARIRRGEKAILDYANHIITIHPRLKQQLCNDYQVSQGKVTVITDGYCEQDFKALNPRALYPGRLNITFLGGSYWGFQEQVMPFLKNVSEIMPETEFVFIGRTSETLRSANLPNLTLISNLPQYKALDFAAGGDFLLLVTLPTAKWHTPSKLYYYLRLGKPVLALVPEDGDAAQIIKKTKTGYVLSYQPDTMRQQLKAILENWRKGESKEFQPDPVAVAEYERSRLIEQTVKIFNAVSQ